MGGNTDDMAPNTPVTPAKGPDVPVDKPQTPDMHEVLLDDSEIEDNHDEV